MRATLAFSVLGIAVGSLLAGCDQTMRDQPKILAQSDSKAFAPDPASRPLPDNTVARSDLQRAKDATTPPPATPEFVARGQARFNIFCSPCHGLAGYGDGIIVERGLVQPPSYHDARLLAAPAQHFYNVITDGFATMHSYASSIPPRDRWAIVAYIRALQLSQNRKLAGGAP